jgi:hypothetical protein
MDMETLGLSGFVLAAIAVAKIAYERRMDVLYGHYIRGHAVGSASLSVKRFWRPGDLAIDRFRSLEETKMIYLSSMSACFIPPASKPSSRAVGQHDRVIEGAGPYHRYYAPSGRRTIREPDESISTYLRAAA